MKSLTLRASRSATPVNPISTKSFNTAEGNDNPESKVPMIRQSSSLMVCKEKLPMVRKTSALEVYKPNLPQLLKAELKKDIFLENKKNDILFLTGRVNEISDRKNNNTHTLKSEIYKLLYGAPPVFGSEIEKNRHELKENFLRFVHQQNYAEEHRDVNPLQRLFNGSNDGFKVTRQDKSPYIKTPEIIIPNDSKEELLGASGLKVYENIFSFFFKKLLNKEGQVIPVSATNLAVYGEKFPTELANKVFAHVASLNKAFTKRGFDKNVSLEIGGAIKNDIFNELSLKEEKASPFTSASFDTPRKNLFSKWGAADEFIEIDLSKSQYLSPTYIVSLILFATDCPEANQKTSYKWRDSKKELWDDQSLQATEKLLVAHGIDPNGEWTEREKIAYYTLIADEYLILGVTPPDTAKIVKAQSES